MNKFYVCVEKFKFSIKRNFIVERHLKNYILYKFPQNTFEH